MACDGAPGQVLRVIASKASANGSFPRQIREALIAALQKKAFTTGSVADASFTPQVWQTVGLMKWMMLKS